MDGAEVGGRRAILVRGVCRASRLRFGFAMTAGRVVFARQNPGEGGSKCCKSDLGEGGAW